MSEAVSVLAARRDGEPTSPVIVDRRLKSSRHEDDVVELAEHRRMCITELSRGV
jgi:hypothetical protein